jgi:hypothetical protein
MKLLEISAGDYSVVGNFGEVRSLVANLNFSFKNEITRINSDMAQSIEEILTIAMIVWEFT